MCGAGWNGDDCSRRYFAPGGVAGSVATGALGDDAAPDAASGANFALDPDGVRADRALDVAMGPEPRIDLDYNAAPETTLAPAFGLAAPAGMPYPGSSPQTAGLTANAQAGPGAGAGAMSPQAVSPGLALEGAQGGALGRLEKVCALDCGRHGSCADGTCQCQTGWQGETCQDPQCPNDCHGRGTCAAPSPDYPGSCTCNEGWAGDACELSALEQASPAGGQKLRHKELSAVQLSKGFTASSHHMHREVSVIRLA